MIIDHMLNGRGSHQHHLDMIKEAQHDRLVAEARKYRENMQKLERSTLKRDKQSQPHPILQQIRRVVIATAPLLVK